MELKKHKNKPRKIAQILSKPFVKIANKYNLIDLVGLFKQSKLLNETEAGLLAKIFSTEKMRVRDIMIPRGKVKSISVDDSIEEVFRLIKETPHSRMPLFAEDNEKVEGIVLIKDLFIAQLGKKITNIEEIIELARKPFLVSESMLILELLKLFQNRKQHMAIVRDEFEAFAGIITLEDVIEPILGEIDDEFNWRHHNMITQIDENTYAINANISLEELKEKTGLEIEENYIETLGGFVTKKLGHFPTAGEELEIKSLEKDKECIWTIRVMKSNNRKIILLRLEKCYENNKKGEASEANEKIHKKEVRAN